MNNQQTKITAGTKSRGKSLLWGEPRTTIRDPGLTYAAVDLSRLKGGASTTTDQVQAQARTGLVLRPRNESQRKGDRCLKFYFIKRSDQYILGFGLINALPFRDPAKCQPATPIDEIPTLQSRSMESYFPTGTRRRSSSKKFSRNVMWASPFSFDASSSGNIAKRLPSGARS